MADQTAVTHGSYAGPVCKFCGAVMTCLSCPGGNVADHDRIDQLIDALNSHGLLDEFNSREARLIIEAWIGARRKEAAAPEEPTCCLCRPGHWDKTGHIVDQQEVVVYPCPCKCHAADLELPELPCGCCASGSPVEWSAAAGNVICGKCGAIYKPTGLSARRLPDEPSPVEICPTCGHYKDTPNHNLGCGEGAAKEGQ